VLSKVAGFLMGPVVTGNAFPAFLRSRYSGLGGVDDARADDGRRPAGGEWEVRGDAPADTRFHFRAGMESLVHPGQAGSWLSLRICLSKTVAGA
jgi:hypothetical protein